MRARPATADSSARYPRTPRRAADRPRRSVPPAEPRLYFFFLAGALAGFAADLGAGLAPALAELPFADGFDADPLIGAFEAALAGALAAGFAAVFAAAFGGAFAAGLAAAAFADGAGAGAGAGVGAGAGAAAGFAMGRGPPVRSENAPGRWGGAFAAATAAAASRAAFSTAAFSAAILEAVGRAFSLAGFLEWASSASRISLSASSWVIWPRRTMYCTRSRALSIAKPARPAAALITSFIAEETLLPASWLMSCARSAISATVSRMSAPRCPGPRRGAGAAGAAGAASSVVESLSTMCPFRSGAPGEGLPVSL